ncbi:hypothetical protein K493DRAFT_378711 [Basidiobolus meristosporus CBS 931.73]|uniref:Uncharacterized protein n=1 Tax=Basidiobolus meristosporus CBS 931.73 TaxID=1314790 RepID=A0A1Y1Y0E2_9FUNG|nr:hypothetical protein K493DRAFT_378711 [Basidiobolus meristosporus CBS 931.73]|eukprot:ORX91467.1 hypothetical protein K493DRAFT_378711 [Basidiobolus meristosporus CBS 931.73]
MGYIVFRIEKLKDGPKQTTNLVDTLTGEIVYRNEPTGPRRDMDAMHLVIDDEEKEDIPLWESNPTKRATFLRLDSRCYKSQVIFDNDDRRPVWFQFTWKDVLFTWERAKEQFLCFGPKGRVMAILDVSKREISILDKAERFATGTESLLLTVGLKVLDRGKRRFHVPSLTHIPMISSLPSATRYKGAILSATAIFTRRQSDNISIMTDGDGSLFDRKVEYFLQQRNDRDKRAAQM